MEDYILKAQILYQKFGIYGIGNFDLTIEDVAVLIKMLEEEKDMEILSVKILDFYERLYKTRMG